MDLNPGLGVLACLAVLLAAGSARADQCQGVSPEQAQAALKLLKKGVKVVEYCEPCGDAKPGEPEVVATASLTAQNLPTDPQTVRVNGKDEDLAYLFVQKSPGDSHYSNLAILAKCPATGVSSEIDLTRPPRLQKAR